MSKFKQGVEVTKELPGEEIRGFLEKVSKPKAQDLQKRQTYMIDKDLIARMDRLSEGKPRGFKVWLVNEALREKINRLEAEARGE